MCPEHPAAGNIVLSDDVETAHVESIPLSFLPGVESLGLAAVQKGAQDASSIDLDLFSLFMFGQFIAGSYYLCHLGHGGSCLANALV